MMRAFGRNVKSAPQDVLESIIETERPFISTVIENPEGFENWKISVPMLNIICSHVEEKINDNKKK